MAEITHTPAADQLVVYKQITGANADEGEAGAQRAKEENAMLWSVADAIAGVPKPKLKEALELNGRMFGDKASPFELRHTIADGLLNGRLPPCPWCKCEALEQEGDTGVQRQGAEGSPCSNVADEQTQPASKRTEPINTETDSVGG